MVERQSFKRSLLGISPSNASSYLRQHRKLQEEERSELEMTVLHLQDENTKLQAELDVLTTRQREQVGREQYQDLIRARGEAAMRVVYEHTQEELTALQDLIDQKRLEQQQKLNRIEEQTDYYKQTLQSMLQEFGATMQEFNLSKLDQWEGSEFTSLTEWVTVPQASERVKKEPRTFVSRQNRSVVLRTSHSSRTDASTPEQNVHPTVQQSQVTPETLNTGKSAVSVPGTHPIAKPTAQPTVKPTAKPVTRPLERPTRVVQEQPSEFWGSIQSFVDGEAADFENEWELEASASVEVAPYEEKSWMANEAVGQQEQTVAAYEYQAAVAPNAEGEATSGSEVVSQEIMSIRNRYIVGKMAGEDLLDSVGRLIVAKNEPITAKVVEIAEREGKLSDLIVNMKIPGVSVDPS